MKSYTDLSQSRKLAEFLPLESADMYYEWPNKKVHFKDDEYSGMGFSCWSLSALLKLLPKSARLEKGNVTELCRVVLPVELEASDWCVEPIDACYEMIIHLHELNLL